MGELNTVKPVVIIILLKREGSHNRFYVIFMLITLLEKLYKATELGVQLGYIYTNEEFVLST